MDTEVGQSALPPVPTPTISLPGHVEEGVTDSSTHGATKKALLDDFATAVSKASRQATFSCGGCLPIVLDPRVDERGNLTPGTATKMEDQRILTKPVKIRWGNRNGEGRVLSLPARTPKDALALEKLVGDCTPATFGRRGKDVLDEGYRRAGAMSTEDFMTDFCPYEAGIIDIVTQLLLPSISGGDLCPSPETPFIPMFRFEAAEFKAIQAQVKASLDRPETSEIHASRIAQCLDQLGVPLQQGEPLTRQLSYMLDLEGQQLTGEVHMTDRVGYLSESEMVNIAADRLLHKENVRRENEHREGERRVLAPRETKMMSRGLRAELYKLNVYSGPTGMFKKHVDTPRSETLMGSLVVCLPVGFEGKNTTLSCRNKMTD